MGTTAKVRRPKSADVLHLQSQKRKKRLLELVGDGFKIIEACQHPDVDVTYKTYETWRYRDRKFRADMDRARAGADAMQLEWTGTRAEFAARYFGMNYASFQLMFLDEIDRMPPGNIVLALWPPEHGKTTTFENFATQQLAEHPNYRITVASEGLNIAKKIVGRVRNRFEPNGPYPRLVQDFGPFRPPRNTDSTHVAQPWSQQMFNVYKKASHDERDYSMMALGWGSSIVSTRCDLLHVDDLQSTKTKGDTAKIIEWFRQDALSRPGEHGKTSMAGTRVAEDDVYAELEDDDELEGILKVIKFKAIVTDYTDPDNPVQRPLWPERYTLDMLDRQRRKVKQEAWDRNYMQNPGASKKDETFGDEHIDPCKNPLISLRDVPPKDAVVYVALDPAIGGMNCVMAAELGPNRLRVRAIREQAGLRSNEQIMQELNAVVHRMNSHGARVTDVVIEAMNFQKGLARDERLLEMQKHYGFATREHLTGWNKYDENIGIPSMLTSFVKGEIELPWADDEYTRAEIGELITQLKKWRPRARGNKLRQDRVMALWFIWILWRSRWKVEPAKDAGAGFQRTVPWRGTKSGLIVPTGAWR